MLRNKHSTVSPESVSVRTDSILKLKLVRIIAVFENAHKMDWTDTFAQIDLTGYLRYRF